MSLDEDDEVEVEAAAPVAVRRTPNAKMRRAFDDLDVDVYRMKRERRHRRQRFVRVLRKLAGLCASCGGSLAEAKRAAAGTNKEPVTCLRCLHVDKSYKTSAKETEQTARYVDEFGRPMRLKFATRMLPVIGLRYDGERLEWPLCPNLSACMTEVILACGAKEAPGASCPKTCADRGRVTSETK